MDFLKEYKVVLISMSGVRVYNKKLMKLGLTLPGFVERSKVIASLPSLGLLTIAAHTPRNWQVIYKELDEYSEEDISEIIGGKPHLIAFSSFPIRSSFHQRERERKKRRRRRAIPPTWATVLC